MSKKKVLDIHVPTDIDFEIKSTLWRRILAALLALLVAFVCGYQLYAKFRNRETMVTETAVKRTLYDTIVADAYVIREEEILESSVSGTVVPDYEVGSKVSVNDRVARVFYSEENAETALAYSQNEQLIEYYERIADLSTDSLVSGLQSHTAAVTDRLLDVQKDIAEGKLNSLADDITALNEAITKRQIAVGNEVDVSGTLQTLYTTRTTLAASMGKYAEVYSHSSGFYVNDCDGYESAYTFTDVADITKETVTELLNKTPSVAIGSVGKIITAFNWYLVCNVTAEEADALTTGGTVKVSVEALSNEVLNLTLKAKNRDEANETVTLVFVGNLMNEEIAALRKTVVKIHINEVTGYAINPKAMRTVDGEVGVYIQLGNIVRFRKVLPILSDENVILVTADANGDGNEDEGYIKLYDEIITEGTDIYEGKIIG